MEFMVPVPLDCAVNYYFKKKIQMCFCLSAKNQHSNYAYESDDPE